MFCLLQPYFKKCLRCLSKIKLKYVCATVGLLILLDVFGAFTHILEISYDENFVYPYHGDIQPFVDALRHGRRPEFEPINEYNYSFLHEARDRCVESDNRELKMIFLVKTAIRNYDKREGIRNSWGFGKRFYDVPTRLVFLLGSEPRDRELARKIDAEAAKYKDILQADFIDSYYNNTMKTMMGFKWAVNHCANAKFYMFVDDDVYVSVKNVLRFVRNPAYYPDYFKEPSRMAARKREIKDTDIMNDADESSELANVKHENSSSRTRKIFVREESELRREKTGNYDKTSITNSIIPESPSYSMKFVKNVNLTSSYLVKSSNETQTRSNNLTRKKRQIFDLELPEDVRLFAGYVFVSSPHRHKTSKWYVSLKEYPYHMWPPYVTAGAYVLSKEALLDMYYASLYTKYFKFDDVYLGIVAKKANVEPFHCDEFHFYKKEYTKYNYKYVITSHGYDDPNEMVSVWQEQKSLGNA